MPAAAGEREFLLRIIQFAIELLALLLYRRDSFRQFGERRLEVGGGKLCERGLTLEMRERCRAGRRFNAADAGGDAAFGEHREHGDVAGALDVRAAAQFDRIGLAAAA